MKSFKSFYKQIFDTNESNFEARALKLFNYQAQNNVVYQEYIKNIGINISQVNCLRQIPFLPVSFFKTHEIKTGRWEAQTIFESSGTTGQVASQHHVKNKAFYLTNTGEIFQQFYGPLTDYHFLALLPSYMERGSSSLVLMASHFIEASKSEYSGFFLHDLQALIEIIKSIRDKRKIILLGVSFALLYLAEKIGPDLSDIIIMETGGMKGRRKEMIRAELHDKLTRGLNVPFIHSEYGMTELMSQAYSGGNGLFKTPSWMRVLLRDLNDPFDINPEISSGGINIIDLGNVDTCAFIETQDIGRMHEDGVFEVLGRFDNSDVRGCNLMVY